MWGRQQGFYLGFRLPVHLAHLASHPMPLNHTPRILGAAALCLTAFEHSTFSHEVETGRLATLWVRNACEHKTS